MASRGIACPFIGVVAILVGPGVLPAGGTHAPGACRDGDWIVTGRGNDPGRVTCSFELECPASQAPGDCSWTYRIQVDGVGLVAARSSQALGCGPEPIRCSAERTLSVPAGFFAIPFCNGHEGAAFGRTSALWVTLSCSAEPVDPPA